LNVALLLLPAVGGHWFLSHNHMTRYRYNQGTGYHTLLASAFIGILLYGIAHVLLSPFDAHFPEATGTWVERSPELITPTVQVSLLLSVVFTYLPNLFLQRILGPPSLLMTLVI
jgi:hypothetical protein